MATTETFYVSSRDNKVRRNTKFFREYFEKGGKKLGQAKYFIEVFGYEHEKTAKKVKEMVQKAGMDNSLFLIKVETR